jgi:hypothetical protein
MSKESINILNGYFRFLKDNELEIIKKNIVGKKYIKELDEEVFLLKDSEQVLTIAPLNGRGTLYKSLESIDKVYIDMEYDFCTISSDFPINRDIIIQKLSSLIGINAKILDFSLESLRILDDYVLTVIGYDYLYNYPIFEYLLAYCGETIIKIKNQGKWKKYWDYTNERYLHKIEITDTKYYKLQEELEDMFSSSVDYFSFFDIITFLLNPNTLDK